MKKTIATLFLALLTLVADGQDKTKYIEVNTGVCTGIIPLFPGASVLYGATQRFSSGMIFDYSGGIAFPTLVTGKAGFGCMMGKDEFTIGVRAWPSTYYAQMRLNRPNRKSDVTFSVESGLYRNSLVGQTLIVTVGWRWDNLRYGDIRKKENR
jgi:hypothetical protein